MIGNVDIKSRPLRLGFLVDPSKVGSVKQAIEIASTLWGGAHFPLIPIYNKRTPKNWESPFRSPKPESVVRGYIEAFDPDILVQCIPNLPKYIEDLGLDVVKPPEIWQPLIGEKEFGPNYGVGIFEIYDQIFEEHFRYKERYPLKVTIPKIPRSYSLFWSSVFGSFPKFITRNINSNLKSALEITTPKVEVSKLKTMLQGKVIFPRRATQYGLNYLNRSGLFHDSSIFFMDATKILDIIDYWNLRALGRQVIPLPIQFLKEPSLKEIITKFIVAAHRPNKYNPQIYYDASFIRSRNTKMEDMQEYVKSLDIKEYPNDRAQKPTYSLQHWYPRIWDDWARDKDGAEANDIYHQEERIDISETDKKLRVQIKPLQPDFVFKFAGHGTPRVANEIAFHLYGSVEAFAQVFPKSHGDNLTRTIADVTSLRREWRVGRNGLVKLVKDTFTDRWDVPKAQDVFFAWLKDQGWNPKLSTPGLLAKQIYQQMDGSVRSFANEKLLKLLEHMNGGKVDGTVENERELSVGEVKNRLKESSRSKSDNLHDFLISRNVFRIGSKIQCPNCNRSSWYSLENIKENITCPRCLNSYPAVGNLDASTWHYKTAGPFSIPGYADGAYCVLLSIEFMEHQMHGLHITPSYSFESKGAKGELEADFASLWQEQSYRGILEGVIFGECKTFGVFQDKDFKRMRFIAKNFPGAVLAFCTLRTEITTKEKQELTKIAKAGRKQLRSERPINPVLILTGNELFNQFGPPYCWEGTQFKKKFEHISGIMEIADATQQIYLGLPSWHDEWFKKYEERKKKFGAKKTVKSK